MAKKKKSSSPAPSAPPAESAPASGKAGGAAKQPWRAGLDFIGVVGGAILIALIIKAYVFDVYLIPSGSMETSLHGRPDGGDRIFCSKLHYRFRDVKRWEVAVFEFPYEAAKRSDPYGSSEQYRGQYFVKRVVGLPGETMAIARGDIWTRPAAGGDFRKQVKPDSAQRDVWLNVYEEDFSDITREELGFFWNFSGKGEIRLQRNGPLVLAASEGETRMAYRPRVPAGLNRDSMAELPGVPDRYTLDQPVQFKCRNRLPDGETCGHVYVKSIHTQNIQARCPVCRSLEPETSAIFYHRRSGLPAVGAYAVNPAAAPQGEQVAPRQADYHIVPDLRGLADVSLSSESAWYGVTVREDERGVQAVFHGDGRVELRINGAASRPEHRAVSAIRPGKTHRLEFYMVDGTARVFVDSAKTPLLEAEIWSDRRPQPRSLPKSSGIAFSAGGGDATIGKLVIDRDIFYYSGWERPSGERFGQIGSQGEAFINQESFFPMGDHCPSSYDARSWGPTPLANLRGPALLVWWPPERIKRIATP